MTIFEHSDLTDKEFRALVVCVTLGDSNGEFVASAAKLGKMAQTDQRYAFKVLAALTSKGYLETVKSGNGRAPARRKITNKALRGVDRGSQNE